MQRRQKLMVETTTQNTGDTAMSDKQPDPMDFLKNMWGPMGFSIPGMSTTGTPSAFPGMTMPSYNVESLQKRIADLKSVENWLMLNLNVVKGSIQALEMQ